MVSCDASWTHVHMCAANGDIDGIRNLQEVDIVKLTHRGETAMHIAAAFGQLDVVQYLMSTNQQMLEICTQDEDSVLQTAVIARHTDIVKLLIPNPLVCHDCISISIQTAVRNNYLDGLVVIVENCPEALTFRDAEGNTFLHFAVTNNAIDILKYLLTVFPTNMITAINQAGRTPLHEAVDKDSLEMVILLYNADASAIAISDLRGLTPFLAASCYAQIMEYFLCVCPTCVSQTTTAGLTALHMCNVLEIAQMLVAAKPSLLYQTDNDGNTPLHFGSDVSSQITEFLIQCKPDLLFLKNNNNQTPLHFAICEPDPLTVRAIFNLRPSIVDTNDKGVTALHVAVYNNYIDDIDRVFTCDRSIVNCRDETGNTPFHLAIQADPLAVKLFLPHIYIETAVDAIDACNANSKIDLQATVFKQCESLNTDLLPELAGLVYSFLGFTLSKKRKLT